MALPARAYSHHVSDDNPIDYDDPAIVPIDESAADVTDARRLRDVARAFAVLRTIAYTEKTLYEVAAELGVNQRTVRRYVAALRAAGLDVIVRQANQYAAARYRLDRRSYHGLLHLPRD